MAYAVIARTMLDFARLGTLVADALDQQMYAAALIVHPIPRPLPLKTAIGDAAMEKMEPAKTMLGGGRASAAAAGRARAAPRRRARAALLHHRPAPRPAPPAPVHGTLAADALGQLMYAAASIVL